MEVEHTTTPWQLGMTMLADDYLQVIGDDGREYDSDSPCICRSCRHGATMGDFYVEE